MSVSISQCQCHFDITVSGCVTYQWTNGRRTSVHSLCTCRSLRQRTEGRRTDIYVVNPGYRINEDEGRTIATSVGNVKYSYYRGLDRYQDPMIQGIFGGKINV